MCKCVCRVSAEVTIECNIFCPHVKPTSKVESIGEQSCVSYNMGSEKQEGNKWKDKEIHNIEDHKGTRLSPRVLLPAPFP